MSEMVDRAVEALKDKISSDPYLMVPNGGPNAGPFGLNLKAFVRTVIEAMREPPKEFEKIVYHGDYADDAWHDAIDAILKD